MKPAAEWDWIPIVATVVAVAIAVLITIAAAYAIGASVQLCPRELAVWSERIYEARRFKATANIADAPLLPIARAVCAAYLRHVG